MLPNLNLESPLSFKRDDDDARSAQKEISIDAARVRRDTIKSGCAFLCGGQNVNENSNGLRSTLKIRAKFQRFFPSTNDLQSCFDQKRDLFEEKTKGKEREKRGEGDEIFFFSVFFYYVRHVKKNVCWRINF